MLLDDISKDEEEQSFISEKVGGRIMVQNIQGQIKFLPPLYLALSMLVLSAAILSQFQNARAQTFPLFLELPFQKNQLFTIGNALITLVGIIIYYLVYQANQKKSVSNGKFRSRVEYSFSLSVLLSGVMAQVSFLAFALLPMDFKNQSTFLCTMKMKTLDTEDRVLLTFSFVMSFTFTAYYMYFSSKIKRPASINQQIKAALFTVICFLFAAFISVNAISLVMGMPLAQGEPSMEDGLSANEDFVALMVSEIYSTLAYSLYLVNNLFVGMYYSDMRTINLVMTVETEIRTIRTAEKTI